MILLVPVTPEVPKPHVPVLWPALLLLLMLGVGFLVGLERTHADFEYVNRLKQYMKADAEGRAQLTPEAQDYLRKRPLLSIAPAKGDWDFTRLIAANFLHGSVPHLILNWIGLFAGARICTTFIPFLLTLSIFLLGGSLGLLTSMWLSTETSAFIPHIGASGGIFALMGTYYVYNFRFRTQYFFWIPSRHGTINLKTSWFFFVDVILLELVLSTGQFLPERVDSVDHLAHVVGFASGVLLALGLRFFQRWPSFLQTRAEYLHWSANRKKQRGDVIQRTYENCLQLLQINPYNDQVKIDVCQLFAKYPTVWQYDQLAEAFRYFSPTFVRLHSEAPAQALAALIRNRIPPPGSWLAVIPYDSIIRLAQAMATTPENQPLLLELVASYRRAHPEGGHTERKLELLMAKLASFEVPAKKEHA